MTGFIIALAVTFLLGLALVIVLVTTGRSALSVRLMKVAGTAPLPAEEHGPGWRGRFGLLLSGATAPIRSLLGFSVNTKLVRNLALAGFREPGAAEIFYSVKLLLPWWER